VCGAQRTGAPERRVRNRFVIKRVVEVDPLKCPECGGQMKTISFLERCQPQLIVTELKFLLALVLLTSLAIELPFLNSAKCVR
jgi:hypothetical protein